MFNFINAFGFQVSFDAEAFKASAKKVSNKVADKTLEGASWALNKAEQKVSQWRTERVMKDVIVEAEFIEIEKTAPDTNAEERDWYTELYEAGLDWGRAIKDGDDEWCLAASDNAVYTLNDAIKAGINPVLANDLLIKGKLSA